MQIQNIELISVGKTICFGLCKRVRSEGTPLPTRRTPALKALENNDNRRLSAMQDGELTLGIASSSTGYGFSFRSKSEHGC